MDQPPITKSVAPKLKVILDAPKIRMAAYEENLPERLVRFEEAKAKRLKVDTFVEAEILGDEDVGDDDMTLGDLPPGRPDPNFSVFENLEEEMDARELSRKRSQRAPEEDEEEQARTMKYQIHESEIPSENQSDVAMGSVDKVWICSFSQNQQLSASVEQYLSEIKQLHKFIDDRTVKTLDSVKVFQARKEDLSEVHKHSVYKKVPITQCIERTGRKPIGTRWVDINKGDDENPNYRSRIVAQEFNSHKRDDLFAATPPLEAINVIIFCCD